MVAFKIGNFGLFWNVFAHGNSKKGRAFVEASYTKRGGATNDLKRVYGSYLAHKRKNETVNCDGEKAASLPTERLLPILMPEAGKRP